MEIKTTDELLKALYDENKERAEHLFGKYENIKNRDLALNFAIRNSKEDALSEELLIAAVDEGAYLRCVPKKLRTFPICKAAIKKDPEAVRYVPPEVIAEAFGIA